MDNTVSQQTHCSDQNIVAQLTARAAGYRKNIQHHGTLCCRCHAAAPLPTHRYCRTCKNAHGRKWLADRRAELLRLRALVAEG